MLRGAGEFEGESWHSVGLAVSPHTPTYTLANSNLLGKPLPPLFL